jgi:hypothetical protein
MHLPKEVRNKRVDKWVEENLLPIGEDPLEMVNVWKARASKSTKHCFCHNLYPYTILALDECDYNGHLSNSSYAKVRE